PIPPNQGRTIAHARGETVVPKQPERVVVLGSVLDALALGVEPVGAALSGIPQRANQGALAPLFGERTEAITVVGHTNQPSLEGIVKLQPDLILGAKEMGNTYSRLAQIAPTVAIDVSRGAEGWKDYVLEAATAMGKADQAKTLIQQYEQRIAQFQTAMGDRLDNTVVSVVRFRPDHVRIYQQNSFSGAILAETGLPRPVSQQRQRPYEAISLEKLSAMDGDVLFFMQDNPEQSILTEVENHPLWSQLDVVQRNQIHEISLEVWFLNSGIVSANMMLNDLFRTLVPDGEQYVVDRVGELVLP
ncbi:MAG: ABC transporter substrate-binding protein, partial [Leptolyngbyaceae cyanobacterium]